MPSKIEICLWKEVREYNLRHLNRMRTEGKFTEYNPKNIMRQCERCDGLDVDCETYSIKQKHL